MLRRLHFHQVLDSLDSSFMHFHQICQGSALFAVYYSVSKAEKSSEHSHKRSLHDTSTRLDDVRFLERFFVGSHLSEPTIRFSSFFRKSIFLVHDIG
jgi:hypothetical protein